MSWVVDGTGQKWAIGKHYPWGFITLRCTYCKRATQKDVEARYADTYSVDCRACTALHEHCIRCYRMKKDHKHIQGRRFCSEPYFGIFKKREVILDEDMPF